MDIPSFCDRDLSRAQKVRAHGLTLIELLVVVGIIAVLIALLVPALTTIRDRARTMQCLSNLRQVGFAFITYTAQNDGHIVPVAYYKNLSDPSGKNWTDTWATILVTQKLVPYPRNTNALSPPQSGNVFQCPSGSLDIQSVTTAGSNPLGILPKSRKDEVGMMGYLHQSKTLQVGLNVFVWYGLNGSTTETSRTFPARMIDGPLGGRKMLEIKKPNSMALLFDGLWGVNLDNNANRLNARHNGKKVTNISFWDGHAESFNTKTLPGGDGDANPGSTTFGVANLQKYPYPQWRLDQ